MNWDLIFGFVNALFCGLTDIKSAGTFKSERVIVSKQGPSINVSGNANNILNFCANNYLGLSVSKSLIRSWTCK